MFRGLTVVIIIVGLVALLVLGPRYLRHVSEPTSGDSGETATCDLDFQACEWTTPDGVWSLSLAAQTDDAPGRVLTVGVPQGVGEDSRVIAVLKGRSRSMGEYSVVLKRDDETGNLIGNVIPPVRTHNPDMIWVVTLLRGQTPVEMNTTAIFQAHAN